MHIGIIGGGLYGVATAYFLERFGAEDVVLFERGKIAEGSTGKSAAIVRHHYSDEIQIRLSKRGREILESFEEYVGCDAGFRQNGYLIMAGLENEPSFREIVQLQQSVGLDVDLLAPGEMTEYMPSIDPSGVAVAAIEHEAGFADPYKVTDGFAEKAAELGTTIHTNTPVVDVEMDNGCPSAIITEDGSHQIDYVVNAAGPWGAVVGEMVDLNIPLEWHESRMAELDSSPLYHPDLPTISDIDRGLYAKPESGGHFIAGGAERDEQQPIDPDTGLQGVDATYLQNLREELGARLPGLADVSVTGTWSGIITTTPDWHHIVGVPDEFENFYNVLGPSGHGFKEGPAFAESIAQSILGESSQFDLSPYRLERFAEDKEFVGKYGQGSRA
jgi:sarcosine oxidase subunit beta